MYNKIVNLTIQELVYNKRINSNLLGALADLIFHKAGVPKTNPIPSEYFDAIKEGICEIYYDGIEPEFSNEKDF